MRAGNYANCRKNNRAGLTQRGRISSLVASLSISSRVSGLEVYEFDTRLFAIACFIGKFQLSGFGCFEQSDDVLNPDVSRTIYLIAQPFAGPGSRHDGKLSDSGVTPETPENLWSHCPRSIIDRHTCVVGGH